MVEVEDYSDYLVLFDIPPSAAISDVLAEFERFGEINHFCFVGKDFHIGRAFIKFSTQEGRSECLQASGYNNFTKPEYENINSSIFVLRQKIIVTPIQEKEAVLMRRKSKSMRNMSLLTVGYDVGSSIYKREDEMRDEIKQEREKIFFSDAEYYVSKRTVRFYNCPKYMNKGHLREVFRRSVENFCANSKMSNDSSKEELAEQIDTNRIRIINVELNNDGSASITFSNHQCAYAAIWQLNGNFIEFHSFSPIVYFDLRKKKITFPGAHIIPEHPFGHDPPPPPPF